MASPLTDAARPSRPRRRRPDRLPHAVRRAVAEIAGAAGAWCPALSPEGDRVAYVTDRSGHPAAGGGPRSTAGRRRCCPDPPRRSSRSPGRRTAPGWPTWSAPAARSAPSCTSSAPTAPTTGVVAGEDPRATVFAGGWTGPGHYVCSIAPGDGPDADIVLVDVATGEHRTLARGGFLSVTAVSADERFVLARRGPRGYRHIVVIDVATGVQRRVLAAGRPGRRRLRGRPVRRRRPLGATCAPRCPARPFTDRAGLVAVPLSRGRRARARAASSSPARTPTSTATRCAPTAPCSPCGAPAGSPSCWCTPCPTAPLVRQIALPEPVMPGWSLSADGATHGRRADRPAAPARAVGRPARRRRRRRRAAALGAAAVPTRPRW